VVVPVAKKVPTGCTDVIVLNAAGIRWRTLVYGPQKCITTRPALPQHTLEAMVLFWDEIMTSGDIVPTIWSLAILFAA